MDSEGMRVFMFALFSPTITQTPFAAQDWFARDALLMQIFSGGEDDCLGSTESLFAAWAHCEGKSGARQLD